MIALLSDWPSKSPASAVAAAVARPAGQLTVSLGNATENTMTTSTRYKHKYIYKI